MRWFWRLFHKSEAEKRLDQEVRFHLEQQVEYRIAQGMAPAEARRVALLEFGGLERVKEDVRDTRWETQIDALFRDIRYATRRLAKSPGFLAVVVLSLALGIGANTAVFSVMNAVILHAPPYEHPEELATIWSTHKLDPNADEDLVPIADVAAWKKANHVFADIGAVGFIGRVTLTGHGEPVQILIQSVTPNFFNLVGVQPVIGRVFRVEESQEVSQTVVISDALWKTKFNGDAGVLGKTFRTGEVVSTVVGVMPAGFKTFGPWATGKRVDVWQPANPEDPRYANRLGGSLPVARLKPGVTLEQAQLEMDVLAQALEKAYPQTNKGVGAKVVPLYETLYKHSKTQLYPLLGAVAFILLIGCVNVANLMLARTESRRKEYSVRASLGAGRRRLMQQLLVESGLLTLLGGLMGVLLSFWGIHLLRAFVKGLPDAENIHINGRVLLFAGGLSLLTTLLFGMAPAVRASGVNLHDALRQGESRSSTGKHRRTQYLLVISEAALAMVLLVGTGLMLNSLLRVLLVSPGFDPANVLTMAVKFGGRPSARNCCIWGKENPEKSQGKPTEKTSPKVTVYQKQLLEGVAALPGVESVGMITILPPMGAVRTSFSILGHPTPSAENRPQASFNEVSPDYFRAMRIPLKKGRYFDERDTRSAPWVVVISETTAIRYFPNEDPIGQQILLRYYPEQVDEERPRHIVGVVGEVKQIGMGGLHPLLYEPYLQQPEVLPGGTDDSHLAGTLCVRTSTDVHTHIADIVAAVKQMIRDVDPDQPVTDIRTLDDLVGTYMSPYTLYVTVIGVFAGMATILSAIGVFGVLSYFVSQHMREMGIRFALGAQRRDVFRLVTKLGLKLAGTGLAMGVALALGLNRFMKALFLINGELRQVKPTDPATYAAVGILFLSIALLACYVPARRATNVDPMTILRHE